MNRIAENTDNVQVIILAGSRNFGWCNVAARYPAPLWPVLGKSVLKRMLVRLTDNGAKYVTICSHGDSSLLAKEVDSENIRNLEVNFADSSLPVGTAGAMRDAMVGKKSELLVVFPAGMINPPDINMLIAAHRSNGADLTMVFNPGKEEGEDKGEAASIYLCNASVLEYIPADGYYDIKESLIPELIRTGKHVRSVVLPHCAGNFRDVPGYLHAMADYLGNGTRVETEASSLRRRGEQLWVDDTAEIDTTAQLFGPVAVMAGARIAGGAIVFGPSIIGPKCNIGRDSIVANSVLWDASSIDANCEVKNCLFDYGANISSHTVVQNKNILFEKPSIMVQLTKYVLKLGEKRVNSLDTGFRGVTISSRQTGALYAAWLAGAVITAAFLWSYWPEIVSLWNIWQRSDEYSSGMLVPFLAGYIMWSRRQNILNIEVRPCMWGVLIFLAAQAIRLFGLLYIYDSADRLSIVMSIAGLTLFLLGWQFFKRTATVMLFLLLMLPWPGRVQSALTLPLQEWATASATFCLEVIGYDVVKEGNVIHIGQTSVAVAEACNGLRMITAFFVISALVIMLIRRQWWEKLVVLVSSLPIALLCNTIRLAITAIAFTVLKGEYWEKVFHDFGGYAMMPLALAAIVAELWLLGRLTAMPEEKNTIIITRG
jgi:exosortase